LGSDAVFSDVNFAFIPDILAQNDAFRPAAAFVFGAGAGGLRLCPAAFALARPAAFSPPDGLCPAFLCHAGVFIVVSVSVPEVSKRQY